MTHSIYKAENHVLQAFLTHCFTLETTSTQKFKHISSHNIASRHLQKGKAVTTHVTSRQHDRDRACRGRTVSKSHPPREVTRVQGEDAALPVQCPDPTGRCGVEAPEQLRGPLGPRSQQRVEEARRARVCVRACVYARARARVGAAAPRI